MTPLVKRASRRYMLHHRWQIALAVIGIALGVAVVIAVDLANESARRAFMLSKDIVTGNTTHHIVGGPSGVEESLYPALRIDQGLRNTAPVVKGNVTLVRHDRTMELLGIDPFAEGRFRGYLATTGERTDITRLLTEPRTGLLSQQTAAELNIDIGDQLTLSAAARTQPLTIVGLLRPDDEASRHALSPLIITDIATAQEILGRPGVLSRIDLIVPPDAGGTAMLSRVRQTLPASAEVIRAASHTRALEQMTHSFQSNLTALSLLALIVGVFLIYNTMTFSVVQRRHLIGLFRALGVTRREIFLLILGEAVILGCLGTLAGVVLGIALGQGLVHLVTRTINDLYFLVTVRELIIAPLSLLKGLALGVGGTLLAAAVPALEATHAPPRAALSRAAAEQRLHRNLPLLALTGTGLLGLGGAILYGDSRSLPLSYGAVFVMIIGFALLVPPAAVMITRALQPLLHRASGSLGGMAARGITASLSRTGVAMAALTIAVATTIGVGVMIDSFRDTLANWLQTYLRADIYLSSSSGDNHPLDPALVKRITATPGVATHSSGRHFHIETSTGHTEVLALDLPPQSLPAFQFKEGNPDKVWPAFKHDDGVIVSEPYAYHHRLHAGDTLTLRTDAGPRTFPVAGIFYHYGTDQGVVFLSRGTYEKYWRDGGVTSLGLYAAPGIELDELTTRLRNRIGTDHQLSIRTNRTLRELSLEIFDRTFAITGVLRILTIVVAFIGILSALMALQLERARELAVLRAIGLTPNGLRGLVTTQTGLIGLIAGLLAIPLGLVLAVVLIYEINRMSFGWTMQLFIDPVVLIQALLLALAAALLAGVYPALKMARTPPALALRED